MFGGRIVLNLSGGKWKWGVLFFYRLKNEIVGGKFDTGWKISFGVWGMLYRSLNGAGAILTSIAGVLD